MTAGGVKRELSAAFYIARNIMTKSRRLAELRHRSTLPASGFAAGRVSGTPQRSKVESYVVQALALEEKIKRELAELYAAQLRIQELINVIPDARERAMLEDYHLNGMILQKVGDKYNYSRRQVINILNAAYEKIALNFTP